MEVKEILIRIIRILLIAVVVVLTITALLILFVSQLVDESVVEESVTYINPPYIVGMDVNFVVDRMIFEGYGRQAYLFYTGYTENIVVTLLIIEASIKEQVPLHLAMAVAWHESVFDPGAINVNYNGSRDIGVYQLNENAYPEYSIEDLVDLDINIRVGIGTLARNYKAEGSWIEAVCKYNRGHVTDLGIEYVSLVYEKLEILDRDFNLCR